MVILFVHRDVEECPSTYLEKTDNINITEILNAARPATHKFIITFANLRKEIWSTLTNIDAVCIDFIFELTPFFTVYKVYLFYINTPDIISIINIFEMKTLKELYFTVFCA